MARYRKLYQKTERSYSQFEPLGRTTFVTCCDCGLVHAMQVRVMRGGLYMRVKRDKARTNARRKQIRWASAKTK